MFFCPVQATILEIIVKYHFCTSYKRDIDYRQKYKTSIQIYQ